MKCPKCGSGTSVIRSFFKDSVTHRVRECVVCKDRFGTAETVNEGGKRNWPQPAIEYKRSHHARAEACGLSVHKFRQIRKAANAEAKRLGVPKEALYRKYGVLPP